MTNKTEYDKIIKPLIIIAILFVAFMTINSLENTVALQQNSQMSQLSEIITYEINRIVEVNELVENYQTSILKNTSKEIVESLEGKDISELTPYELKAYVDHYPITGIALFKDMGDDVIIEKSTSDVEVGLSTNKWGFWYTAFRQLFDDGHVSIDKGAAVESFWIGPRSKAYEQKGFFIFSYEKIPNQPYLLNLFLDDKDAFNATNTYDTSAIFTKLANDASFINEIAIINVDAWNNRFQHEYRSKLQDYTVEYGTYKAFSAEDTYYLNKALDLNLQDSLNLKYNKGKEKLTKRYTKLSDNEVLIFVLNRKEQDLIRYRIAMTVLLGLVTIWFLAYILTRYHNKESNRKLYLEKERLKVAESYKQTVQILPSVVLRLSIINGRLIIRHCEGKSSKLLGMDSKLSQGDELKAYLPEDYLRLVKNHLENMAPIESSRFEYTYKDRIFENKIEWVNTAAQHQQNNDTIDGEVIILWNDITELRQSEDRARFMAYHDHLTELPNRRYFKETIKVALENSSETLYLAFIDLDGFKCVNDSAGHDIGDELLIAVAHTLSSTLGGRHFVARMGGDEFAVLFKDLKSKEDLEILLDQLKKDICKEYDIKGNTFTIGMSIGISQSQKDGNDYVTLLKKADIALYDVKYSGKGTHKYYDDHIT